MGEGGAWARVHLRGLFPGEVKGSEDREIERERHDRSANSHGGGAFDPLWLTKRCSFGGGVWQAHSGNALERRDLVG